MSPEWRLDRMTTSKKKALQRAIRGLPNKLPVSRGNLKEPEIGGIGGRHKLSGHGIAGTLAARVPRSGGRPEHKDKREELRKPKAKSKAKFQKVREKFPEPNFFDRFEDKAARARASGRRNKLTARTAALRKAG